MWAIFSFLYNSILIIFIAVHLLISFCVGVYIGIYLCQNYELPTIDEPHKLWLCFVDFLEKRKKPGGTSVFEQLKRRISFRRSRSNVNEIRPAYAEKSPLENSIRRSGDPVADMKQQ